LAEAGIARDECPRSLAIRLLTVPSTRSLPLETAIRAASSGLHGPRCMPRFLEREHQYWHIYRPSTHSYHPSFYPLRARSWPSRASGRQRGMELTRIKRRCWLQRASDTRCLCNHRRSLLQAGRSYAVCGEAVTRCWTDARSDEEPVLNGRHPAGGPPSPDIRAKEHSLHRAA
jgi:hypothetical protein